MKRAAKPFRVFSLVRFFSAIVLGFLLPLSYMVFLSVFYDYMGTSTPQFLVWPFGWPRPLWIMAMGREPTEDDIVFGLLFMAVCNIALYGTVSYLVLSTLSLLRNRPVTNVLRLLQ